MCRWKYLTIKDYPLTPQQKTLIEKAILLHENPAQASQLEIDALYDADKLQWGLDPLNTALWELCHYDELDVAQIIEELKQVPKMIASFRSTLKTETGRELADRIFGYALGVQPRMITALEQSERG